YANGQGVPQGYGEAVRWSRKAAEQGDAKAQYSLGASCANGLGVPQDDAEAVRWYRKAADQGDAMAQYGLGYMYGKGQGVPQNYAEAVRWYGKGTASSLVSCLFRDGTLAGWTSIAVILLALPILVAPQRRWERARWLPNALVSALCAAALAHEL